jgi:hypothetical protein
MRARSTRAILGAALAAASVAVTAPATPAPTVTQGAPAHLQDRNAALPAEKITEKRVSRHVGPLGMPMFARPGREPWIDKDGRLLRQVR